MRMALSPPSPMSLEESNNSEGRRRFPPASCRYWPIAVMASTEATDSRWISFSTRTRSSLTSSNTSRAVRAWPSFPNPMRIQPVYSLDARAANKAARGADVPASGLRLGVCLLAPKTWNLTPRERRKEQRGSGSPHPLGMMRGAVELRGGLERLVLPGHGRLCGFGEQLGNCRLAHRLESACGFEGLIQALHGLAAVNHNRRRQRQRIVQAFDGRDGAALQDVAIAHGLHPQYGDSFLD